jgi:hypothetical protein
MGETSLFQIPARDEAGAERGEQAGVEITFVRRSMQVRKSGDGGLFTRGGSLAAAECVGRFGGPRRGEWGTSNYHQIQYIYFDRIQLVWAPMNL